MDNFILCYELDNGKAIRLSFTIDIDYEKYNKQILSMYGKHIKRRYVEILKTHEVMSLKQFKEKYSCKDNK